MMPTITIDLDLTKHVFIQPERHTNSVLRANSGTHSIHVRGPTRPMGPARESQ